MENCGENYLTELEDWVDYLKSCGLLGWNLRFEKFGYGFEV